MRKLLRIPIRIDEEGPPADVVVSGGGFVYEEMTQPNLEASLKFEEHRNPEFYEARAISLFEFHEATDSESFVVPVGVTSVQVLIVGGAGGPSDPSPGTYYPGRGHAFWTTFTVTPGETLDVFVGGGGAEGVDGGIGGLNGGGAGGYGTSAGGGGGGGYSAIKRGATFLVIAGGGGGVGGSSPDGNGGAGGHPNGQNAPFGGGGGTQIAGGIAGPATNPGWGGVAGASLAGATGTSIDNGFGFRFGTGGGGGGFFGGGSGGIYSASESDTQSGGGGSSYVSTSIDAEDQAINWVGLPVKDGVSPDGMILIFDAT
jgi:hypothetical protein